MKMLKRWIAFCLVMILLAGVAFDHSSLIGSQVEAADLENTEIAEADAAAATEVNVLSETGGDTEQAEESTEAETEEPQATEEVPAAAATPSEPSEAETEMPAEEPAAPVESTPESVPAADTPGGESAAAGQNTADTPAATPAPEVKKQEAMELKQEVKDAEGNVICEVTANIEEDTFTANTSEVTMKVSQIDEALEKEIKNLAEETLTEDKELGSYFLYKVEFQVNGTTTEPGKEVKITFEPKDYKIDDVKKANVFYYNEANSPAGNEKAEIVEIIQKQEQIEALQAAGQSIENIDKDYDLTEITLKADKTTEKIVTEGRRSTVYGCYLEKDKPEEKPAASVANTMSESNALAADTVTLTEELDDGTLVKLTAPENAFDKYDKKYTIDLSVKELGTSDLEKVTKKLEKHAKAKNQEIIEDGVVVYDINIVLKDKKGKEQIIQPKKSVTVTFENTGIHPENDETLVGFQIQDNAVKEIKGHKGNNGEVSVEAEHFTDTGYYIAPARAGEGETGGTTASGTLEEGNIPDQNAAKNKWQIVDGQYKGNETENKEVSEDGELRLQKNVVATDVENEFLVYLSVDVKQMFREYFEMAQYMATTSNNYHGEQPGSVVSAMTGNINVTVVKGEVQGWRNAPFTIQDPDGKVLAEDVILSWDQANNTTMCVKVTEQKWILLSLAVKNDKENVVRLSEDAMELIKEEISSAAQITNITDIMGDYIEYVETVASDGTTTFDEVSNTLTWTPKLKQDVETEETTEEIGSGLDSETVTTTWSLNVAELIYKVRLDVTKDGFNSCADNMYSDLGDPETYAVNTEATIHYGEGDTEEFPVPYVRGTLYDIEFQKVDNEGKPLSGAEFTITGNYFGENIRETAESGEDGYVKFRNLPWGKYTLTESDPPVGYESSYEGQTLELCYTTAPDDLERDHDGWHDADESTDISNYLLKSNKIGNGGKIVNTYKGITPGPDPDNPSSIPNKKQIDWLGDDGNNPDTDLTGDYYYRLYLDATGIPDQKPDGADIVFILDTSNSMNFSMDGTHGDEWDDDPNNDDIAIGTRRLDYVKNSAITAIKSIQETAEKQQADINIGLVTFNYGNGIHYHDHHKPGGGYPGEYYEDEKKWGGSHNGANIISRFTSDYNSLISTIKGLDKDDLDGRTNYQAAFEKATELLDTSSKNKKYVVFITDGETNGYTDDGEEIFTEIGTDKQDQSIRAANQVARQWGNINGYYSIAVSKDILADKLNDIGPSDVERLVLQANNEEEISKAFSAVVSAITKQVCDVTITDQLSDYVEFVNESGQTFTEQGISSEANANNIALKVTKTYQGVTEEIDSEMYTVTIDETTKTVSVNFGEDYFLEPQATYTISFNVKLTDKAFIGEMNDIGDRGTDYGNNQTSSGCKGFDSNEYANVTFSTVTNGELTEHTQAYDDPVVQVKEKVDWGIVKKSATEGYDEGLGGAKFELSQDDHVYIGESKSSEPNKGLIEWTYKLTGAKIETKDIPAGVYTLKEIEAPQGYSLSNTIWEVTISNMSAPVITPMNSGGSAGTPLTCGDCEDKKEHSTHIFVITNEALFELPESGGTGIYWYLFGGMLLMMGASLIVYKNKRREVLERK